MDFRSLVIPIQMKEGFTIVFADSFPVRALDTYVRLSGRNLRDSRYEFTVIGNTLYFAATEFGTNGTELWMYKIHTEVTYS